MMNRQQLERFAMALTLITLLFISLVFCGYFKPARGETSYMPLAKDAHYVVMTTDEYNELVNRKCKK